MYFFSVFILFYFIIIIIFFGCPQHHGVSLRVRSTIAVVATMIIWAISAATLASDNTFAWVMIAIMGPVVVAAEYPCIPSVDDNGVMCIVPLFTIIMLYP